MTTQPTSFWSEVPAGERIPVGRLAYFRTRLRNRLHDLVLREFSRQEKTRGLTRAEIARRIGRKPEQITRWFASPGNWTLDTVSDLMLAMGAEPKVETWALADRPARNFTGPEWLLGAGTSAGALTSSIRPADRSVIAGTDRAPIAVSEVRA